MNLRPIATIAALALAACAPSPEAPQAPRPDPRVTRSAGECAPLVERVRAHPDSFTPAPPLPWKMVIPPIGPVPDGWAGREIAVRLYVDEMGVILTDSTKIDPTLPAGRYDRTLRTDLAKAAYHPAVVEGCAVPGWATLQMVLPQIVRR